MNIAPNAPAISPTRSPRPVTTLAVSALQSTKGSRDVWSIYWELRLPVTSPAWNLPGLYSLELDYQERFDDFSDFGGTERPKFSVRWQPIDSGLTIRATYSEAYHAPTLSDLFRGVAVQPAELYLIRGVQLPQSTVTDAFER